MHHPESSKAASRVRQTCEGRSRSGCSSRISRREAGCVVVRIKPTARGFRDNPRASTMIAGPANFPVRRQQKLGDPADRKLEGIVKWNERVRAAVQRKLLDVRPEEVKSTMRGAWSSGTSPQACARSRRSTRGLLRKVDHYSSVPSPGKSSGSPPTEKRKSSRRRSSLSATTTRATRSPPSAIGINSGS